MTVQAKIKNFKELADTPLRRAALQIAEAGLQAIDTEKIIREKIKIDKNFLRIGEDKISLGGVENIFVVGVGKCAADAACALEEVLGDKITDGIVLDVHSRTLKKIKVREGDHPMPTERNIDATKEIIEFLKPLNEKDLVIMIISGGGSVLLCQPTNLTCFQEADIIKCLFRAGAPIEEINTIRKHLSLARGGYLAQYAYPARVVSLIFSDVPGNKLEFVASGPTVKDTTTVAEAEAIVEKYGVKAKCDLLNLVFIETPKEDKYFEKAKNILFVSNGTALRAMAEKAKELGFSPSIVTDSLEGEARKVGESIAKEIGSRPEKTALLYGGETTVLIKGDGKGGRNMEAALGALGHIASGALVLSLASDGRDNTDFAGAVADVVTKENAAKIGLDPESYLKNNNSYVFFEETGDYVETGETGSNVSDLIVAIKE